MRIKRKKRENKKTKEEKDGKGKQRRKQMQKGERTKIKKKRITIEKKLGQIGEGVFRYLNNIHVIFSTFCFFVP